MLCIQRIRFVKLDLQDIFLLYSDHADEYQIVGYKVFHCQELPKWKRNFDLLVYKKVHMDLSIHLKYM